MGRICPYESELYAVRAVVNWLVSNPQRLKDNVAIYSLKVCGIGTKSTKTKSTAVLLVMDLIVKVKEISREKVKVHLMSEGKKVTLATKDNQKLAIKMAGPHGSRKEFY